MYETTKPVASSLHERAYRIVLYSAGEMCETTKPVASSLHERAYRIVLYSAGEMCMRRRSPPGLVYTNVHTGSYFIVREKCV